MQDCHHETTAIVRRICSNGTTQIVRQCQTCGQPTSGPMKHSVIVETGGPIDDLPIFDNSLREEWYAKERSDMEAKRNDAAFERTLAYRNYLSSDAWRRKRYRVMVRDSHRCQGCLEATATEVHHLTYKRVGHELLIDLVALCETCHAIAHEDHA